MSEPTRRDAAKAETREALLDAGIALFAEQGLDAPSLDAICARAGYTRGAFYVHFSDREDFQVAVMEKVIRGFLATVAVTGSATDLARSVDTFAMLYDAIRGALDTPDAPPTALLGASRLNVVLEACARSPVVRARFGALVTEGMRSVAAAARAGQVAGTVRDDVAPEQVGTVLVAVVFGLLTLAQARVPHDTESVRTAVLALLGPSVPRAGGPR